jgi:hypothetical protein
MTKYSSVESAIRKVMEATIVSTPRGINTGHVRSGRNSYSSSAERGDAGGHNAAMNRVRDQEKAAKREQEDSKDKMEKEIKQRKREAEKRHNKVNEMIVLEQTHVFHVHIRPIDNRHNDDKLVIRVKAKDHNEARNKFARYVSKNFGIPYVSKFEYKGVHEETNSERTGCSSFKTR